MKKTKLIALTMVVAIMLMGAGYAIWSDQVFLTTTIKTGEFDIQITDVSTRTGDNEIQNEIQYAGGNKGFHKTDWTHANNAKVGHNKNEAWVELRDLYPGGAVQVDIRMDNMGTLPAKLESIVVSNIDESVPGLFNLLTVQSSWKADIDGAEDKKQDAYDHVDDFKYWRSVQDGMNALVDNTKAYGTHGLVIEPGGWLALGDETEENCIVFKLDSSAGNKYQNASCKFKITFNWEQWASDPLAKPYEEYGGDGDKDGIQTSW
jgi:hypothetical protein